MTLQRNTGKGYIKLLSILLSLAIIPCLIISSLAYFVSIDNAKKQAVTYSSQYLNLVIDSNTAMLQQAKGILYELMLNFDNYSDILRNRVASADALNLLTALEKKKLASEAYVKSFYFVDNRSGILYDSGRSAIYSFEDFPDRQLVGLLTDSGGTLLLNDLFARKTTGGDTVASYVVRYPLTGPSLGYLIFDLDMKRFVAPSGEPNRSYGHFLILNRHGDLVNAEQKDQLDGVRNDPGDYVIIRGESADTKLSYEYAIPKRQLTANNRILLITIMSVCAVLVLFEVLAAWFSSRRLYTPLRNLLRYIKQAVGDQGHPSAESGDEYFYLQRVITHLNVQNKDYNNAFQANGMLFRQRQLSRLLLGETSADRSVIVPDKFKLKLPHPRYAVMVLEVGDRDAYTDKYTGLEQELMLFSVMNIAEEVLKECGEAVSAPLDPYRAAVLINYVDLPESGGFEAIGHKVQEQVGRYLKMTLSIGIGPGRDRREDIRESFEQAGIALSRKAYFGKGSILSADKMPDLPSAQRKVVSWSDTREQLKVQLQNGAWEPLWAFLSELCRKTAYAGMTEIDLQLFYLQYTACLSDLCAEFSIPFEQLAEEGFALEGSARRISSIDELGQAMIAIARRMHEKIKDTKDHIHQELIRNILQYIREHLDQDLTLESIAEKVYMHPAYLSRICKSLTGKGLGEQIVQARVDRAKELLLGSNKSVNDISFDIGYANPRAFYRLFKEYTGLTPGEFRKYEGLKKVK